MKKKDDLQDALRWKFLLEGNVEIIKAYAEEDESLLIGILVTTPIDEDLCSSPSEVNDMIDRAIKIQHFSVTQH